MSVKEFVYLIQNNRNDADLYINFKVQFSYQISLIYVVFAVFSV